MEQLEVMTQKKLGEKLQVSDHYVRSTFWYSLQNLCFR